MRRAAILVLTWMALAGAAVAQMEMPKPGPEHKKLDMLAGSWTVEADVKPSAMGQGGKITEDEKCEWMEGGFFLVCHVDFKSPTLGSGTGLSVIGYSNDDKAYTYREFNSMGEAMDSKGSLNGDTWVWSSEEKMGGAAMKGRFSMKFTSSTTYTFTYDTSPDGTKWTTVVDGKGTKK